MSDDELYGLLTSAAENLRSADKDERRVEAAFRIAFKLDAYCKELSACATPADHSVPVAYEWRMKSEGDWLPLFPSDIAMMCAVLGHEARPATADHISQARDVKPFTSRAAPISEYHEDFGPVVWWASDADGFWLGEPAWVGKPDDDDWPGYHTHWTFHPLFPEVPADKAVPK